MKKIVYSAAAVVAAATMAPAAHAVSFIVNVPVATTAITGANAFAADLGAPGLLLGAYTTGGISLDGPAFVKFEFMGTESGAADTFFTVNGTTFTENVTTVINNFGLINPPVIAPGSELFGFGALNVSFKSNIPLSGITTPGTAGFGVFLPSAVGVGSFSSQVLYFGFDDQIGANDDDNHDDLIIRASIVGSPVPEPATWAFMLVGFGAVGYSLRRRPAYKLAQAV